MTTLSNRTGINTSRSCLVDLQIEVKSEPLSMIVCDGFEDLHWDGIDPEVYGLRTQEKILHRDGLDRLYYATFLAHMI